MLLSVLLGSEEHGLRTSDLVRLAAHFGVAAPTARVALSRLVTAGELVAADSVYSLSARHRSRRERQEAALRPRERVYDGRWRTVVVTGAGREAADRAQLRRALARDRFGELREGVWMRPGTEADVDPDLTGVDAVLLTTRPDDDRALAARLWDLATWSEVGHGLLRDAKHGSPRERFVVNAAVVRHLRADPDLPPTLLPADWPGDALRQTYTDFRRELAALAPPTSSHQERA